MDPVARDFVRHRSATAPTDEHDLQTLDVESGRHRSNTLNTVSRNASIRERKRSNAGRASFEDADGFPRRTSTVRKYHSVSPARSISPGSPGAHYDEPGAEPGIDPLAQGFPARFKHLLRRCQITVVDFSAEKMEKYELNNQTLLEFLDKPRPDWVGCRWMNVNGLSWDVIKALGGHHKLHRLAIEDLMNTTSRTKADWYRESAFMLLTLQKLVRVKHEESEDEEDGKAHKGLFGRRKNKKRKLSLYPRWPTAERKSSDTSSEEANYTQQPQVGVAKVGGSTLNSLHIRNNGAPFRTLQRYRGSVNPERAMYMERNSALTKKNLAVSVEQVSMFLTQDRTVISFFEHSADDIEDPILRRLSSPDTILRRTADPSMMVQAVLDAIVDLAQPLVAAYEDTMAELELDVLTDPELAHSRLLYILSTELITLRNNMQPIASVIAALREHRNQSENNGVAVPSSQPLDSKTASNVTISQTAHVYLGDVEDHTLQIVQNLDLMRRTTSDMIDLIFNQMSSFQNESMRQLTTVTIFFLPLTFLTGYFGMNFHDFASLDNSDAFFWYIAVPIMVALGLVLSRPMYVRFFKRTWQKMWIQRVRKARRDKARQTRERAE